jgi:asparagine synthetase B (glutamine-hydrolysing)
MCGIAGVSGLSHIDDLNLSLKEIKHRGPDDHGTYIDFN